jgi:hypothetical protein
MGKYCEPQRSQRKQRFQVINTLKELIEKGKNELPEGAGGTFNSHGQIFVVDKDYLDW